MVRVPDPTFLVRSGKFSPDPYLDPFGTLAMQSCINKEKIFLKYNFYTFSGEFFHFSVKKNNHSNIRRYMFDVKKLRC